MPVLRYYNHFTRFNHHSQCDLATWRKLLQQKVILVDSVIINGKKLRKTDNIRIKFFGASIEKSSTWKPCPYDHPIFENGTRLALALYSKTSNVHLSSSTYVDCSSSKKCEKYVMILMDANLYFYHYHISLCINVVGNVFNSVILQNNWLFYRISSDSIE